MFLTVFFSLLILFSGVMPSGASDTSSLDQFHFNTTITASSCLIAREKMSDVGSTESGPLTIPDHERFTEEAARRMIRASRETLEPVYEPLAEQIVADYDLAEKPGGIGIDLGSGPGNLILELSRRTNLHWINADINPHFFAHFYAQAEKKGVAHRVSAVFADAGAMPFRDHYADIIVSRGSYPFWEDQELGFREIMRVLKPGGVAYIGRGFARDMPVEIARSIRARQGRTMDYDLWAEARKLETLFDETGIETYRIKIPEPAGAEDVHYGIWIELRKPE